MTATAPLRSRFHARVLRGWVSLAALVATTAACQTAPAQARTLPRAAAVAGRSTGFCAEHPLLRCPDLVMSAPSELHMDRTTIPGRVLLRATSSIDSVGRGPMEVRARRVGRHRWHVYQALYDRKGRAHLFLTKAQLVFKLIPGERYGYGDIGSAHYWKFKHAAAFQLWSVGPHLKARKLVRTGPKVDYCLRDLERTHPSRRSPPGPVYPGCSEDAAIRTDRLGTSIGWSDIYPFSYPEQWIDVTGLHGRFAFVQRVDPDRLLIESDHSNDVSETYIDLPSGRVIGHRVGVSRP